MNAVEEIFGRVVTFAYNVIGPRGRHTGIDLRSRTPEPIGSPVEGRVVELRDYDPGTSYGRYVVVQDNATPVRYLVAHLSGVSVLKDQHVAQGQVLGQTGNSGGVAPHLHYEVRVMRDGRWIDTDPRPYMRYDIFTPLAPNTPGNGRAGGDGASMPDVTPVGLDLNPFNNIADGVEKAAYWLAFMLFAFGLIALGAYLFFKPELKAAAGAATKAAML